jgi:hypothetical protein
MLWIAFRFTSSWPRHIRWELLDDQISKATAWLHRSNGSFAKPQKSWREGRRTHFFYFLSYSFNFHVKPNGAHSRSLHFSFSCNYFLWSVTLSCLFLSLLLTLDRSVPNVVANPYPPWLSYPSLVRRDDISLPNTSMNVPSQVRNLSLLVDRRRLNPALTSDPYFCLDVHSASRNVELWTARYPHAMPVVPFRVFATIILAPAWTVVSLAFTVPMLRHPTRCWDNPLWTVRSIVHIDFLKKKKKNKIAHENDLKATAKHARMPEWLWRPSRWQVVQSGTALQLM